MIQRSAEDTTHIDVDEVASYLDRTLSDEDRRRVEAHLFICDECRAEVSASSEAVSSAPPLRGSRLRSWQAGAGAVAAAALIVIVATTLSRSRADRDIERDSNIGASSVTVTQPGDGLSLGADRLVIWHKFAESASYRVTIADQSAQPIYTTTVTDTSAIIPSSVKLAPGKKYFWYVDAIRANGATATSGLKSFKIE